MATEVSFHTIILQLGNNTGIEVPESAVQQLGAGKKPAVKVTLNNYTYQSTIAVMGGKYLIPLSAERRQSANIKGGDEAEIHLELDTTIREVAVPDDLQKALDADPEAKKFFDSLSYSSKRGYVEPLGQAKTEETRLRRLEKAIAGLRAGKK